MRKKRKNFIKPAACAVLGIALCGSLASAEEAFSVNGVNGYTRLIAEADFEGLPENQPLPVGKNGIGIFDYRDEMSAGQQAVRAVRGPTDAIGSQNHHMVAELPAISDGESENVLGLRYAVIDPDYDPCFSDLKTALSRRDTEAAFRAAHTLKGVAQNLGFSDLQRTASELTEALRGAKPLMQPELLDAVRISQKQIADAMKELDA